MKKRNDDRLTALLLGILMVLSLFANPVFAANGNGNLSFKDVPKSAWYYDYVMCLADCGIVKGYGDTGEYRPMNKVIREHAAKMVARAAQLPYEGMKANFPDVDPNGEMSAYIAALVKKGAVQGFPDGSFRPLDNIKRGHAAKIVQIAFDLKESYKEVKIKDFPTKDAKVAQAIKVLASNGIVKGYDDSNLFKPNDEINRAEFAKMLCVAMAAKAVQIAEGQPTNSNINQAQAQINRLSDTEDTETKAFLQGRLDDLKEEPPTTDPGGGTVVPQPDPEVTGFTFTQTGGLKEGEDNAKAGAVAGTLSAPVGGTGPFTYDLVAGDGDDDNSKFEIDGANLKIKDTPLVAGSYKVRIQVEDSKGKTFSKAPIVTVGEFQLGYAVDPPTGSTLKVGDTITVTAASAKDLRIMLWAEALADVATAKAAYMDKVFSSRLDDLFNGGMAITKGDGVFTITINEPFLSALAAGDYDWRSGDKTSWIITPVGDDGEPIAEFNTWTGARVDETFFVYTLGELQPIEQAKEKLKYAIDKIQAIGDANDDNDEDKWFEELGLKAAVWGATGSLAEAIFVYENLDASLEEINLAIDTLLLAAFKGIKLNHSEFVLDAIAYAYDIDNYFELSDRQRDKSNEAGIAGHEVRGFIETEKTFYITYGFVGEIPKIKTMNILSIPRVLEIMEGGIAKYSSLLEGINAAGST